MPGSEKINRSAGALQDTPAEALPVVGEDAFCSLTNRIVIVSPLPQRLHELIRGLSAACFDVMVFHQAEPDILSGLRADLLIVDRTVAAGQDALALSEMPELAGLPILQLVGYGSGSVKKGSPADGSDTLPWPSPLPVLLEAIRHAAVRSTVKNKKRTGSQALSGMEDPREMEDASGTDADRDLRLKELTLDQRRHTVYRGPQRIDLTKTEFDVLKLLMEAGGSVMSRQEMMDRIWGEHYYGGSNTLDVHVKALRRKLDDDPKEPRYIATVRGIGYRLAD